MSVTTTTTTTATSNGQQGNRNVDIALILPLENNEKDVQRLLCRSSEKRKLGTFSLQLATRKFSLNPQPVISKITREKRLVAAKKLSALSTRFGISSGSAEGEEEGEKQEKQEKQGINLACLEEFENTHSDVENTPDTGRTCFQEQPPSTVELHKQQQRRGRSSNTHNGREACLWKRFALSFSDPAVAKAEKENTSDGDDGRGNDLRKAVVAYRRPWLDWLFRFLHRNTKVFDLSMLFRTVQIADAFIALEPTFVVRDSSAARSLFPSCLGIAIKFGENDVFSFREVVEHLPSPRTVTVSDLRRMEITVLVRLGFRVGQDTMYNEVLRELETRGVIHSGGKKRRGDFHDSELELAMAVAAESILASQVTPVDGTARKEAVKICSDRAGRGLQRVVKRLEAGEN